MNYNQAQFLRELNLKLENKYQWFPIKNMSMIQFQTLSFEDWFNIKKWIKLIRFWFQKIELCPNNY
jgi:hypothetical protein